MFRNLFGKEMKSIDVNDIEELLGKVHLIDIREPYEYKTGSVRTAENIPMNTLLQNPEKYLKKEKEYYILCQSGGRSSSACERLTERGFHVTNVKGGVGCYKGK